MPCLPPCRSGDVSTQHHVLGRLSHFGFIVSVWSSAGTFERSDVAVCGIDHHNGQRYHRLLLPSRRLLQYLVSFLCSSAKINPCFGRSRDFCFCCISLVDWLQGPPGLSCIGRIATNHRHGQALRATSCHCSNLTHRRCNKCSTNCYRLSTLNGYIVAFLSFNWQTGF
jgi:hypothetical protein